MTDTVNLEQSPNGTLVHIPMKLKKRGGRKEIIVPDGLQERMANADMDVPFAIALARGHVWQELFESGKYRSIKEMANDLGVDHSYMYRLLRFTNLAPDIIEAIIYGQESDEMSQTKFMGVIPADWCKQRERWMR